MGQNGSTTAVVTVTNTGKRDGAEVVQLYIRDLVGSITRPVRELKGFEKVFLLQTDLNKATSDIIAVYVYEQGIQHAEYSYSTAIGLFNTAVNIVLLIIVSRIAKKASDVQFV